MKRVGRWTWMLLTLLLLLCGTVLAAAPERTSIALEQPIEVTFEDDEIFRYTLTAPIDGMRVQVEWLTASKDFTSLKIAGRTAYGTNGIYNLGEHGEKNVDLTAFALFCTNTEMTNRNPMMQFQPNCMTATL